VSEPSDQTKRKIQAFEARIASPQKVDTKTTTEQSDRAHGTLGAEKHQSGPQPVDKAPASRARTSPADERHSTSAQQIEKQDQKSDNRTVSDTMVSPQGKMLAKIEHSIETEIGAKGVKVDTKVEVDGAVARMAGGAMKVIADPSLSIGRTEVGRKEVSISTDATQGKIGETTLAISPQIDIHPPSQKGQAGRNDQKSTDIQASIKASAEFPVAPGLTIQANADLGRHPDGSLVLKTVLPGQESSAHTEPAGISIEQKYRDFPGLERSANDHPRLNSQGLSGDHILHAITQMNNPTQPPVEKSRLIPDLHPPKTDSFYAPKLVPDLTEKVLPSLSKISPTSGASPSADTKGALRENANKSNGATSTKGEKTNDTVGNTKKQESNSSRNDTNKYRSDSDTTKHRY
jgi:hypothetical protein